MRSFFIGLVLLLGQRVIGLGQTVEIVDGQKVVSGDTYTSPSSTNTSVPSNIGSTEKAVFRAEDRITFINGFKALSGSYFRAVILPPNAFAELKDKLDGGFVTTINNWLHFKLEEKFIDGNLDFTIYNYKREAKLTASSFNADQIKPSKTVKVGANFYSINLKDHGLTTTTDADSYYILEAKNSKGEIYLLRFKLINI